MFSGLNLTNGFNVGVFVSFSACTGPKNRVYILSSGARDEGFVLVAAHVNIVCVRDFWQRFVLSTFGYKWTL